MQTTEQPTLKVRLIHPGRNYRRRFSEEALTTLKESIRAAGRILAPITVRPHPSMDDGLFEIIVGERRWRAAKALFGDDYDMPVVVIHATDAEARALSIIENHEREDTSEVEEAQGAAELLAYSNHDKETTARQLGWSIDLLERRLLLLHCAQEVQEALIEQKIRLGHAELLSGLSPEVQVKVLNMLLERKVPVEELRKQLGQFARRLSDAIFDTSQCSGCVHNSSRQAALFDQSIGDGYCQHPNHYEELTLQHLEAQAAPLREKFQVVRIYRAVDGFQPLHVTPDGELGVGVEQFGSCKSCASFGCAVSAVAGSYGAIDESLCFDASCHSQKVLARRRAAREARATGSNADAAAKKPDPAVTPDAKKPSNNTPPRIAEYRVNRWRRWAANHLMAQPERSYCVLAALVASSSLQAFQSGKFVEAAIKIAGPDSFGANPFKQSLELAAGIQPDKLLTIVQAAVASSAFGIDLAGLEVLLNYLEIDEAKHFTLDGEYLELLTVSELEALADELKLRKAMGDAAFKKAKAGPKAKLIEALLKVDGFSYAGAVPKAIKYTRKKLRPFSAGPQADRPSEPHTPQATVADDAAAVT
jgi:ParB family transcriptional regulator, chromosome partitioning protein